MDSHTRDDIGCGGCVHAAAEETPPGVDRRAFLLAAAAFAVAACAGDAGNATAPQTGGSTIDVSAYPALANTNGVALVTLNGSALAIVRTGASTFAAFSRRCPHQGATISTSSGGFTCPRHGARFDLAGNWVGGQRTSNLRSYSTTYDAATQKLTIG